MEKKISPLILCIESSTTNCSVGLVQGDRILEVLESNEGYSHAENIAEFVKRILDKQHIQTTDLDAVAIGKGPGSYTGLRIGTALAKGMCYASSLPLIAVNSLKSMAAEIQLNGVKNQLLLPLLDARRMEVYAAVYDDQLNELENTSAEILDDNSFAKYIDQEMVVFGPGAEKFHEFFKGKSNIRLIEDVFPSVNGMSALVGEYFENQLFEDIAYFEPFYLKDFVAGPSKKIL